VTIHAVVLAAGASSRYGTTPPKQQTFLPRVLTALEQSAVDDVVVGFAFGFVVLVVGAPGGRVVAVVVDVDAGSRQSGSWSEA